MNANNLTEKARDLQEDAQQAAQNVRSRFQEKARALQDTAQEWQRSATDSAQKAARTTDAYVRDNPWTVVGYVAVGCLVLGILLGRRRN